MENSLSENKNSGWRGSRELWLETAREALLESGVEAVKIMPLASRLDLSRTSFYWFFKDRHALLEALLDLWEETNTGGLVRAVEAYSASPSEAVLNLIAAFVDEGLFDPRFDFAVRGWARQSAEVMARVNAADAVRLDAIRRMFERHGFAADEADVRARTAYLVQIGYISMQVEESLDVRMKRIPAYVRTYCGQDATEAELARFYDRCGYQPD